MSNRTSSGPQKNISKKHASIQVKPRLTSAAVKKEKVEAPGSETFKTLSQKKGFTLCNIGKLIDLREAGSIANAAGRGDLKRQNAYSQGLIELSKALGIDLTTQQGNRKVVSEAGHFIADVMRDALLKVSDYMKRTPDQLITWTIAAGETPLQLMVIPALAGVLHKLKGVYPSQTKFTCLNKQTEAILRGVHEGDIDFGVIRRDPQRVIEYGLAKAEIGRLICKLYVPRKLLSTSTPDLADLLARLPVATLGESSRDTRELLMHQQKRGLQLSTRMECSSLLQIQSAIRSGGFIGILPEKLGDELPANAFLALDLPDSELPGFRQPFLLIWNPTRLRIRDKMDLVRLELIGTMKQKGNNLSVSPA